MKGVMLQFPTILFSLAFLITPLCAHALDPAWVKGSLTVDGKSVELKNGYAHLHDNAEGVLDSPKELRILLADRDVNESALRGLVFLEVEDMAREGKVRGILMELDPDKPNDFVITYLYPPSRPGEFLVRKTVSTVGKKAFNEFKIANRRVIGELEDHDNSKDADLDSTKFDVSVKFNVALFNEPEITADLKGKEAQNSPQAAVLLKKAEAAIKGDLKGVQKLSTARANKKSEAFIAQAGPQAIEILKQVGAEMKQSVRKIRRVVVRGNSAVVLFEGKHWAAFVKEDGEWKSDN